VRCVLSLSCDLCARLCCDLSLVCVALSCLTFVLLCDHHCKGERLQVVEIPHKREKDKERKNCGIQVDHRIT
jgi:hypothetical protein